MERRSKRTTTSFFFLSSSTRCLADFFSPKKNHPLNRLDATAKAASEAASAADAKWHLSSRARAAAVDARRLYPYYRDKTKKFVATPFGQASAVGFLLFLLWTGVLGRLLNIAFLIYWLAPLLLLPLAQAGASRAQREQQQRARAEEEARRRTRWGGAADWFGGSGRGGGSSGRGESSSSSYSEGEIIDVEVDK